MKGLVCGLHIQGRGIGSLLCRQGDGVVRGPYPDPWHPGGQSLGQHTFQERCKPQCRPLSTCHHWRESIPDPLEDAWLPLSQHHSARLGERERWRDSDPRYRYMRPQPTRARPRPPGEHRTPGGSNTARGFPPPHYP